MTTIASELGIRLTWVAWRRRWGSPQPLGLVDTALRHLVDTAVQERTQGTFPWGTLVVNATGSLVVGFVTGLALDHGLSDTAKLVLGVGLCGAYTTFSTFSYETVRLLEDGAVRQALRNTVATLGVGAAAAALGLALAAVV